MVEPVLVTGATGYIGGRLAPRLLEAGYPIRCLVGLRAELSAPGDGWMEWRIKPQPEGGALLSQIAFFAPGGVLGFLYWYLLNPVHRLVFAGLIKRIAHQASGSQFIGTN